MRVPYDEGFRCSKNGQTFRSRNSDGLLSQVYAQCMAAKGNRVGGPPPGAGPVYPYPPTDYDYHDFTW